MKKKLLVFFSFLFSLTISAQFNFEERTIIDNSNSTNNPTSIFSTDLDGDGDNDVLASIGEDNKIVWYQNLDGKGNLSAQKKISVEVDEPRYVYAGDVDGDGDLDVLSISKLDNKTAWYENIDGLGNFGAQQLITNQEAVAMLSLKDIDGDGDNDLLFLSDFEISWLENIDGKGSFSNKRIIASKVTRFFGSFYLADMNNDGFLDIVGTSKGGFNTVFWIQNEDGYGTYGNLIEIDNTARGAKFAETGDMDGDGDLDIVAAIPNNDDILWYENIDGLGTFTKKVVTLNFDNVAIARVVDIDNDSDLDVIAGANYLYGDDIALYENIDGLGTFRLKQIVTNIPKGVVWLDTGDMDGDNDMDILQASFSSDNLVWYENIDGLGEFGKEKMITRIPSIPRSIITVDIDGDGDEDVASTGMDARISWYDNLDGIGTFSPQKIITSGLLQALFITAGDVDQDNDIDLLAIHSSVDSGNILVWYENTDGNGNFDEEKVIKVGLNAHEIHMADMDGDTDMDIVSNSEIAEIVWYENIDGNFSTKHVILPDANAATILPLDIDNDGDIDVAYGVGNATRGEFQWVENIDGNGNFGSFNLISPYEGFIRHMTSIDFDSDGDFDIVGSSNQLKLSENRNGQGRFSHKSTFQTFSSVDESIGADLDGDGNIDVLYISRVDRKIAWYKNLDGTNFSDEMLIFNRSQIGDIEVTDIDNDGDTDIVLTSITDGKISWLENKDNAEPLNLTATLITPNCNVSDSATIQVDVSGGSVPYNYTLLDESGTVTIVPYQTTNLFENLATGQYIIRVMDSNDQVINDSFSVPDSTPIALELLVDKGECLVDPTDGIYKSGRIKIEPTGGIPPYQAYIARTFGGISNPSVSDPLLYEGLGQGIYEVTVIDAGGCSVFETVQISDSSCAPAELQFTTSIEVNEGSQSLTVPFELSGEINGGFTVDYTINALTAENTTDFDGTNGTLTFAGTDEEIQNITISIIDDNAIEANESFNIVLSNQSSTDVLLLEDTVIATISDNDLIPGSSGISFETSNIVVDEDAEFATLNVTLVGNVQESFTIDYSTVDNDAQSVEDYIPTSGSLTFAGFNGELQQISIPIVNDNIAEIQENFSVSLSNISTTLIPIIENIATVAIKDNTIATPLSITNWELSVITCNGANDASILVNVSGGTPPYSFSLQDQMGNTIVDAHNTNYFENLSSGDYYISVEDATNETTTGTLINISEPTIISASYTIGNASCSATADGTVEIMATGGFGSFEYSLDGISFNSNNSYNNLMAGNYNIFIRDSNGCVLSDEFIISLSDGVDYDNDGIFDSCDDDIDGDGVLNINDNCPETPLGTQVNATGCEIYTLPNDAISIQTTSETCASRDNGSILVTTVENLDYVATLTNASSIIASKDFRSFASFQNLNAGSYEVCITIKGETDFERCFTVTIDEPEPLSVSGKLDPSGKSITFKMSGGESYFITINQETISTVLNEITLPIYDIENVIEVKTDKDCQGVFNDNIIVNTSELLIYPNPVTNGELFVSLPNSQDENTLVALYTGNGSLVMQNVLNSNETTLRLNVQGLTSGMYNLKIETGNKTEYRRILIK